MQLIGEKKCGLQPAALLSQAWIASSNTNRFPTTQRILCSTPAKFWHHTPTMRSSDRFQKSQHSLRWTMENLDIIKETADYCECKVVHVDEHITPQDLHTYMHWQPFYWCESWPIKLHWCMMHMYCLSTQRPCHIFLWCVSQTGLCIQTNLLHEMANFQDCLLQNYTARGIMFEPIVQVIHSVSYGTPYRRPVGAYGRVTWYTLADF